MSQCACGKFTLYDGTNAHNDEEGVRHGNIVCSNKVWPSMAHHGTVAGWAVGTVAGMVAGMADANGADSGATKPSNPKDAIGSRKAPLDLCPDGLELWASEAFLEGALKYGRYNWRIAGVRSSTYYSALKRHIKKWWNGQNIDATTRVHHLKNAIACLTIILDAELYGKLEDDRPPCPDPDAMAREIDALEARVAELKILFAAHSPKQWTIKDTPSDVFVPQPGDARSSP